jgi:SAM-dependent methyltransferase
MTHGRHEGRMCTVCRAAEVTEFVEIPEVPVHCNLLWSTREAALSAPRGDIILGFCRGCGHIFNLAFQPDRVTYTQDYENSLHGSPRFQHYATSLASRLIERYDLQGKNVLEIGCGQGEFLALLCELGDNRGIGFDPSYAPPSDVPETACRWQILPEAYSVQHAHCPADLICCRHVLEHIGQPVAWLRTVRQAIGERHHIGVFFEVPNALYTLRDMGIWDVIYEHCSYFNHLSMTTLFQQCGFDVHALREVYDGQFLCLEAVPQAVSTASEHRHPDHMQQLASHVTAFAQNYRHKVKSWHERLTQWAHTDKRIAVWGAGSKGVMFLNTLKQCDAIAYVVDINRRKHGKYIAGTGQPIIPPQALQHEPPDVVLIMNPIYREEIQQQVVDLGMVPEFACP